MRPDFNARLAERMHHATEVAAAVEQLAAQARATIAQWDAQIREDLRAPVAGARSSVPAGPPELYEQLERELAKLDDEAKAIRRSLDEEEEAADDWESRAMLAVKDGRDDLARIALKQHEQHSESCEVLRNELWILHGVIEDYRAIVKARPSAHSA